MISEESWINDHLKPKDIIDLDELDILDESLSVEKEGEDGGMVGGPPLHKDQVLKAYQFEIPEVKIGHKWDSNILVMQFKTDDN